MTKQTSPAQLDEEAACRLAPAGPIFESGQTAHGVSRHRPEQLSQKGGTALVEGGIGATTQVSQTAKGPRSDGVVPFMENESGQSFQPHAGGAFLHCLRVFLQTVSHVYQGGNTLTPMFDQGVLQDPNHLGESAATMHLHHGGLQPTRVLRPCSGVELPIAPEIDELHIQCPQTGRLLEHARLPMGGEIPGGLTTGGRIDGEDESCPTTFYGDYGRLGHCFEKGVDVTGRCFDGMVWFAGIHGRLH